MAEMAPVHHYLCLSREEIVKRRLCMRKVCQMGESCHALHDKPGVHVQDKLAKRMVGFIAIYKVLYDLLQMIIWKQW